MCKAPFAARPRREPGEPFRRRSRLPQPRVQQLWPGVARLSAIPTQPTKQAQHTQPYPHPPDPELHPEPVCGHYCTRLQRLAMLEFDRDRKSMSVICKQAAPAGGRVTRHSGGGRRWFGCVEGRLPLRRGVCMRWLQHVIAAARLRRFWWPL